MDDQGRTSANYSSEGTGTLQGAVDKVNETKDRVTEYGRKAVDAIDAQRGPAARTLDQTASALHDKSEKAASAGHRTAETIQATADYIRDHDLGAMTQDVTSLVRRYPAQSLAAAAIAGFLVARALRGND